jgi:AraC-like DNA-binding protein
VSLTQHLLCLLQDGFKEITISSEKLKLDNTSALLLHSGNTLMTEVARPGQVFDSILLFFSDSFLLSFFSKYQSGIPRESKKAQITPIRKDEFLLNFEKSLILMKQELRKNTKLINLKIEEVLLYLLEKEPAKINEFINSALTKNKVVNFQQILSNENCYSQTIKEMAFLSNMSISTFKRKFKEAYKTTPKQFFIEQRMKKAVDLIEIGKKPNEFFYDLGYENLSSFSKEFKKFHKVPPNEYLEKDSMIKLEKMQKTLVIHKSKEK